MFGMGLGLVGLELQKHPIAGPSNIVCEVKGPEILGEHPSENQKRNNEGALDALGAAHRSCLLQRTRTFLRRIVQHPLDSVRIVKLLQTLPIAFAHLWATLLAELALERINLASGDAVLFEMVHCE